jgi:hypothetical protein
MLSKIAAQKEAEHESQAALESVARLKTSRAVGLALAPKSVGAEIWSVSQHPTSRSVEDSPDCVVASFWNFVLIQRELDKGVFVI